MKVGSEETVGGSFVHWGSGLRSSHDGDKRRQERLRSRMLATSVQIKLQYDISHSSTTTTVGQEYTHITNTP